MVGREGASRGREWVRIISDALWSLDPRTPRLVIPVEAPVQSPGGLSRAELPVWSQFEAPMLVATDDPLQLAATAAEAIADGPVLLDLGFRGGPAGNRRQREEEWSAAVASIANTAASGALGIVVPGAWLSSPGRSWQRSQLTHAFRLRFVISASGVLDGISTSFPVGCLLFSVRAESADETIFFDLPKQPSGSIDPVADLATLLGGAPASQMGYRTSDCEPGGASLAFDARNPELLTRQSELANIGSQVPIRELFEVLRNRPPAGAAPTNRELTDTESPRRGDERVFPGDPSATRVVTGRDIHPGGLQPLAEDARYRRPVEGDLLLLPGDLAMRAIVGGARPQLTAALITESDGEVLAGPQVIVLRPRPTTDPRVVLATQLFLHSEVAARLVGSVSASQVLLSTQSIADLAVPVPDTSTLDAITSVVDVRRALSEWLSEADSVLETLYGRSDVVAAKEDIQDASRTLRAKVVLGATLDDPYELYRTSYPFPLAYRWRMVEAAYSSPDRDRALREIHEAAEITLAYAACVALVFARGHDLSLPCLKEVRNKLGSGRSGMSFGDWVNILNEATLSRDAKRIPPGAPLSEVRQFFATPGVETSRARLKKQRDAEAHGRHPTGPELQSAIEEAYEDLLTLMNAAAPLSDIALLYLDRARVDTLRESTWVTYRDFRGDHPVIRSQQAWFPGMHYEEDSLYLRDTDGGMHLLRPYMLANACPTCHNWTMFAIDRVVAGAPEYKSLDHGHTETQPDSIAALIHVGLLNPAP
jgi:hypothetical protein